jgi:hypothetical protein
MDGSAARLSEVSPNPNGVSTEWSIGLLPCPTSADGWLCEVNRAYADASKRLITEDGSPVEARTTEEAAILSALRNRGVTPAREEVHQLFQAIDGMRNQLQTEDPQWRLLTSVPAFGFSISYVWTQLGIGAIAEPEASSVMALCAERLGGFPVTN